MFTTQDIGFMQRAIELADRGRFAAKPNPHVGCVLVKDNQIVGEGFTQPPGEGHAEVQALRQAGENAKGATAYVTLEPCNHQGRTGPCSEALIHAGVARVIAAIQDPYPEVAGQGFQRLRDAGIDVEVGLLEATVRQQLRGFLTRIDRGYGFITLKLACSLDGKIALASGESKWITGPAARADVQRLRAQSGLILTGSGTVLADDCKLTVRKEQLVMGQDLMLTQASRAVLDSKLRIPKNALILGAQAPTILCCDSSTSTAPEHLAKHPLCRVDQLNSEEGLRGAIAQLAQIAPANEILLECGPALAGNALRAGLVDELVLYQAPVILGHSARSLVQMDVSTMTERLNFDLIELRQIGQDQRLTLRPRA